MTTMTCPHCRSTLAVTVLEEPPGPAGSSHADPAEVTVAPVRTFSEALSGRFTGAQLRAMYDERAPEAGWPELSPKAFARALKSLGWRPWRTSTERGWER